MAGQNGGGGSVQFLFADHVLDTDRRELHRGSEAISVEPQVLEGTGQCNTLFPRGVPPEYVAGAPMALDIIKCQLKPIDMNDYKGSFSTQQRARLAAIFPTGVCDWSKKGVKQMKSVPWASYGPSPVNQVFDIQDRRRHGDDDDDD